MGKPSADRCYQYMMMFFAAAENLSSFTVTRLRKGRRIVRRRYGVGRTLRPGSQTPLWNALVKEAMPFLAKRGSKARLARFLGLPRQRMQDCLKARHATLDAERTLRFFFWVAARHKGHELNV